MIDRTAHQTDIYDSGPLYYSIYVMTGTNIYNIVMSLSLVICHVLLLDTTRSSCFEIRLAIRLLTTGWVDLQWIFFVYESRSPGVGSGSSLSSHMATRAFRSNPISPQNTGPGPGTHERPDVPSTLCIELHEGIIRKTRSL